MPKFLEQIVNFVKGLNGRQLFWLAAGIAAVAATIYGFVQLIGKADYKTLYSGLAAADAQALGQRLATKNIPYEISTDGTSVLVPADQLDRTRLDLASEGLPSTGRMGFEIFDKPNWAGSDFSDQVNYQRALEGELERTIQTLGEVKSVRVHLVLPHESLYSERERAAKAAVVIQLRGGGLPDADVAAITHLVAGSVDNLSPDNVTLIGADGRSPLVAKGKSANPVSAPPVELEAALAEKIVSTLAPVVGADHVKASVTIDWDPDSGETTTETYDPDSAVVISEQTHQERIGGAVPSGIPGTPTNVPGNAAAPTGTAAAPALPTVQSSAENDDQTSESKTYAINKTVRHTLEPPGQMQKIAAAVIVDDVVETKQEKGKKTETRRKRTADEMKQIEDLTKAAIGFQAVRGDQIQVQNLAFQVVPLEGPVAPSFPEQVRLIVERWMWVIRYAALGLLFVMVYLFVLNPLKKQIAAAFQQRTLGIAEAGEEAPALAGGGGAGARAIAGAAGPALDLEQELAATNSDVQRVVKLKKHLVDKVKKEPAAASRLIRNWIHKPEPHA